MDSNEINFAEQEYMNKSRSFIELTTPLAMLVYVNNIHAAARACGAQNFQKFLGRLCCPLRLCYGSRLLPALMWRCSPASSPISKVLTIYRDYCMVGECVRFLCTSCERLLNSLVRNKCIIKIVQTSQPCSNLFMPDI